MQWWAEHLESDRFHHFKYAGRPVVLGTSSSQPIFAVELIPTRFPVMYESCCALNTFLVPATLNDPLCPTYEWDVPTHANEEFHHGSHRHAPVVTTLPFSVLEYLECYLTGFEFWLLSSYAE